MDEAERLQHLFDERDVIRLSWQYGTLIDRGETEDLAALFTDDATYSYQSGTTITRGRTEIAAFFTAAVSATESRPTTHMVANVSVDIGDDRTVAEGRTTGLVCFATAGGLLTVRGVHYDDSFRRTPDGWRIAARSHVQDWELQVPATAVRDVL